MSAGERGDLTELERKNLEYLISRSDIANFKGREWLRWLGIRGTKLTDEEVSRISRVRALADWEFN